MRLEGWIPLDVASMRLMTVILCLDLIPRVKPFQRMPESRKKTIASLSINSSIHDIQDIGRLVVVKALSTFLTQPAGVDHFLQQTRWSVLAISSLLVQDIHDSKAGIETNKVRQGQRPHGDIGTVLHDIIDILAASNTSFKANDRLINVGHKDSIG